MNTKESGSDGLPQDLPIVQTYDRIQAEFPGSPLPAEVVVSADDVNDTRGRRRGARVARAGDRHGPHERPGRT